MTTGLPLLSCCRSIDSLCRADSTLSSASLFSSYAFPANSVQSFGCVTKEWSRPRTRYYGGGTNLKMT